MHTPSVAEMPEPLIAVARSVARKLREQGHRGWIVGGAVRDLVRGEVPHDVDMVSDATPAEVEALFERTASVGRAFGTVLVLEGGEEVQLTTFRSEGGYSDSRRPDSVQYGSSVEEDATRRDFTCNALYLDPLTDELADPTGGLGDLAAGVLRTVGAPGARFREDGLRLLRMARFEAALDLAPAPGLHDAARTERGSLRGVSAERVADELTRILSLERAAGGIAVLADCGILEEALPGWGAGGCADHRPHVQALECLPRPPGPLLGLATLLEVAPLEPYEEAAALRSRELAEGLRLPRKLLRALEAVWRLRRRIPDLAAEDARRSARIRALRAPEGAAALELARAWAAVGDDSRLLERLEALSRWFSGLDAEELRPRVLVGTRELERAGIPRGPRWSELLAEAEDRQLDGELTSTADAEAWLRGLAAR